jgi:hypothetical protein
MPNQLTRKDTKMTAQTFIVYDTKTSLTLAELPLTLAIGATIEAYERAGYSVSWKWGERK